MVIKSINTAFRKYINCVKIGGVLKGSFYMQNREYYHDNKCQRASKEDIPVSFSHPKNILYIYLYCLYL